MSRFEELELDPALRTRRTASDYVADALRSAILDGQFEDGEELNQVELATHFRVSRVPVREALRRLQAEGLVSAEPHRRAVVVGFSPERIAEIFELRALIEGYMLEKAVPRIDRGLLDRLAALCEELEQSGGREGWLERDRDFHRLLLERADSPTAVALVDRLARQVERYVRRAAAPGHGREGGAERRAILDALAGGDATGARQALEQHILGTLVRLGKSLDAA